MSLVQCKECSHAVSSNALTCPKCGFPVAGARLVELAKNAPGAIKKIFEAPPDECLVSEKALEELDSLLLPVSKAPKLGSILGLGTLMGAVIPLFIYEGVVYGLAPKVELVFGYPVYVSGWFFVSKDIGAYTFYGKVQESDVLKFATEVQMRKSKNNAAFKSIFGIKNVLLLGLIFFAVARRL